MTLVAIILFALAFGTAGMVQQSQNGAMTSSLINVPLELCDYFTQPRSKLDPDYCRSLGENMKAIGQLQPVLGWFNGERFQLEDGGCRWEGAKLVGMTHLLALDLGKKPSKADLLMAQASIDLHKQFLAPVDRARLYRSTLEERGCTAKQLAQDLGGISQSQISRKFLLLDLSPDIQEMVNSGVLEESKGSLIAQETKDPVRQRELAAEALNMTRDTLAKRLKKPKDDNGQPTVRMSKVKIAMPGGAFVTVSGSELGMPELCELLSGALSASRKAADKFDVKTFERMMHDSSSKASA